ncbi:MAG: PIN domain-containing protein [Deltaproteobacteria bacterium]|nr:PIN domain-containing protein [Deltaproteobacteria bacterium]
MIYLDTSVALAHLFAEDRCPPAELWSRPLVSSRLLEYELWTRVHARKLAGSHGDHVRALLDRVAIVELARPVLTRALEPFPTPVRTLDAIHIATIEFLRGQGQDVLLAAYDDRMVAAAKKFGISLFL